MNVYKFYSRFFGKHLTMLLSILTYALIFFLTIIALSQIGADLRYAGV